MTKWVGTGPESNLDEIKAPELTSGPDEKKKGRGRFLFPLLSILFMAAGACLVLYPTFADWWNRWHTSHAIAAYREASEREDIDIGTLFAEARLYNNELLYTADRFHPDEYMHDWYESLLDVQGNGMIGYVEIPEQDISLPIYHGTGDTVLQVASGHLEGTSLPIGEGPAHSVISGHNGLPSAKLFTNITKMDIGDEFYVYVLGQKFTYQVDRIDTVLPDDSSLLGISNEDRVTLMTCVPYGINSHRLFVSGIRCEDSGGGL